MTNWDQRFLELQENGSFEEDQKERTLKNSLNQAFPVNPDQAANNQKLSADTGLPTEYVENNGDEARRQEYLKGVEFNKLLSEAPTTAELLSRLDAAKQTHDDINPLTQVETAWRGKDNSRERTVRQDQTPADYVPKGRGAVARGIVPEQNNSIAVADLLRSVPGGAVEGVGMGTSGIGAGIDAVTRTVTRGMDFLLPESMDKFIWTSPDTPEWIKKFGRATNVSGSFASTGDVLQETGEVVKPPAERQNLGTDIAGGVGQVAGQIAAYMINPAMGTAMLFGQGVEQQAQAQEDYFDGKEAANKLIEEAGGPKSDEIQRHTLGTDVALLAGGGITVALEKIGLDFLIDRIPPAIKNKVLRNLTDVALSGGAEALQETVEGVAHNIIEYASYNPEAQIFEGLEREALAAGGTGAVVRSIINMIGPGKIRINSERDAAKINQVIGGIEQSKLTTRNPQLAREYLEALAESTGSDTIFIDQKGVDLLFQNVTDPEIMENEVFQSIAAQYQDAYETGAKIQVKLSDLPDMVTTGLARELQPYMVSDIDAMSPIQAQDVSIQAEIQSIKEMDADTRSLELEVYDDVYGQEYARTGDRSRAESHALMHEAFFRTISKRDGITQSPMEIYQKYNPTFKQEVSPEVKAQIERMDKMDITLDRIRTGDIPTDQDIFGESLLQFIRKEGGIIDEGGELAAKDAKSIIRPNTGRTLDDMAERAVEEGFMSERDPNALLNLIDGEMRGESTYRLGKENADLQGMAADLNQLSELLDRSGIDLATMSNEEVRAALNVDSVNEADVMTQARNLPEGFNEKNAVNLPLGKVGVHNDISESWREHYGDEYSSELESYLKSVNELHESGGKIYRTVFTESVNDINTDDLGRHWTTDIYIAEEVRDRFSSTFNKGDKNSYIIEATIPENSVSISNVDIQGNPEEKEVNIKGGTQISGIRILDPDSGKVLLDIQGGGSLPTTPFYGSREEIGLSHPKLSFPSDIDPDSINDDNILYQTYSTEELEFLTSQGAIYDNADEYSERARTLKSALERAERNNEPIGSETEDRAERRLLRQLSQERFRNDAERELGSEIQPEGSTEAGFHQITRAGDLQVSDYDYTLEAAGFNSGTPDSAVGIWSASKENSAANYGDVLRDYIMETKKPFVVNSDSWMKAKPDTVEKATQLKEHLLERGYDSIIVTHDNYNHFVSLKPDQFVKSSHPRLSENWVDYGALPVADVDDTLYQADVLTEETPEFKAWAGDGAEVIESDEINDTDFSEDKPYVLKVFHGTTHDFDTFDASKTGNMEGQFGAVNYFTSSEYDATENYTTEGPDLTNRIQTEAERIANENLSDHFTGTPKELMERYSDFDTIEMAETYIKSDLMFDDLAEDIAKERLMGGSENVMELYVRTEKPFVVGSGDSPWYKVRDSEALEKSALERVAENNDIDVSEVNENLDDYQDELDDARYEIMDAEEPAIMEAIAIVADRYEFDSAELFVEMYETLSDNEVMQSKLEELMRGSEALGYVESPETGALINSQVIADIIQELGFDSIILKNADDRFSSMDMEQGTAHVHVFDENNTHIKSVDNRGTFDPQDSNIFYQQAGDETDNLYVAHNLSEENIKHALDLGGLAAPSIAVGNIDTGAFNSFGEITLLADPSMIEDKTIKFFDSDIYSPRQPRAYHKISMKKYNELVDNLNANTEAGHLGRLPSFDQLEDTSGSDALLYNKALQYHWLKSQGKEPKPRKSKLDPIKKKAVAIAKKDKGMLIITTCPKSRNSASWLKIISWI